MRNKIIRYSLPLLAAAGIFFLPLQCLSAAPSLVFTTSKTEEQIKDEIVAALTRTDPGLREEDETLGFSYRFTSRWSSPYDYSIFIGRISRKNPAVIVRLEGSKGHIYSFARILESENVLNPGGIPGYPEGIPGYPEDISAYRNPGFKYHGISQGLNLIAPWASVLYQGAYSPVMSSGSMWTRFFMYLAADVILVSAAGTDFYRQSWDPVKYQDRIAIALALPRLVGMYQSWNATRAHNRIAELKYTFPVD